MAFVRLKIDFSGTLADEAFRNLKHFDQIDSASFGPHFGYGDAAHPKGYDGNCEHPPGTRHPAGEWMGAEIRLPAARCRRARCSSPCAGTR